jgi:hypothetical protein
VALVEQRRTTFVVLIVAISLFTAACGGASSEEGTPSGSGEAGIGEFAGPVPSDAKAYPVQVSSELTVGDNRFLVGLLDGNDAPIGDPSIDVRIDFYDLEESATKPVSGSNMDFIWAVPNRRGLYVTNATFDHAGKWGTEVTITGQGLDESIKSSFQVKQESSTPSLGEAVPASDTPTAGDVETLSEISTDSYPEKDFYRLSIADALKRQKPLVVAFATPRFCQSAVCGPTLDIVKDVAPDFDNVNFVHVEVYSNLDEPSNLKPVPATREWGLPSEPWVFVVDEQGKLAAKYEGVLSSGELRQELQRL